VVRFGHRLVSHFAAFDIDAADERGIFLAGLLDAEIRERFEIAIGHIRQSLCVAALDQLVGIAGQQCHAILLLFDFFGDADDHNFPCGFKLANPPPKSTVTGRNGFYSTLT
jgi:hypothetical protein